MIDQVWLPLATVLLLSAAVLAPVLPALIRDWVVVTRLVPRGPHFARHVPPTFHVTLPESPGTPGTALARAPSH